MLTTPDPDQIKVEITAVLDKAVALKKHTDDVGMAHIHSQDKAVLSMLVTCCELLIKLLELVETKAKEETKVV